MKQNADDDFKVSGNEMPGYEDVSELPQPTEVPLPKPLLPTDNHTYFYMWFLLHACGFLICGFRVAECNTTNMH